MAGLRTDNATGFRGVHRLSRTGKYVAALQGQSPTPDGGRTNYDLFRKGGFESAEEAALAYDEAARSWHGDAARLNFPNVGERGLDGTVREA